MKPMILKTLTLASALALAPMVVAAQSTQPPVNNPSNTGTRNPAPVPQPGGATVPPSTQPGAMTNADGTKVGAPSNRVPAGGAANAPAKP
jgi:hypothetical protein